MNNLFFAKYLTIKDVKSKTDYNTHFSIFSSLIEIEQVDEYHYEMEIYTYNKLNKFFGQFSIGFFNNIKPEAIYILDESNHNQYQMFEVTDKDGNHWWIENGDIDKNNKTFKSLTINTLGNFFIYIHFNQSIYKIYVKSQKNATLTDEGVENLRQAFCGELINLIINNKNSYLKENIHQEQYQKNPYDILDINLVNNYIYGLENIIKNPHKTLNTDFKKLPVKNLKSTQKTFAEYAINSNAKYYTSKVHYDSCINPVNAYLLHITNSLIDYLKQYKENHLFKIEQIQKDIKKSQDKIQNTFLNQENFKKLRISRIKEARNYINRFKHKILPSKNILTITTPPLSFQVIESKGARCLLCKELNSDNDFYLIVNDGEFCSNLNYLNQNLINFYIQITAEIFILNYQMPTAKDGIYEYNIKQFLNIQLYYNGEKEYRKNSTGAKETTKFLQQEKVSKNHINKNKIDCDAINNINNQLNIAIKKLTSLSKSLQKIGVKPSKVVPASTIFFSHQFYSLCYTNFNKIKNAQHIEYFDRLQKIVNNVSIKPIFEIYEYWCLLKIIDILINKLQFFPEKPDWKSLILNQEKFSLAFSNGQGVRLTLYYEIDLPSYTELDQNQRQKYEQSKIDFKNQHNKELTFKKPDFRIKYHNGEKPTTDLIMDAKFHDPCNLESVCKEMADNKHPKERGYRGDWFGFENWVYVLAPAVPFLKNPPLSYTKWQPHAYYGSSEFFEWGNRLPLHKHGGILLTPREIDDNGRFLCSEDNLQRLIIMFLQFQGYKQCIVCGSETKETEHPTDSGYPYYKYTCQNKHCQHIITHIHCQSCVKDVIFKNGLDWTYQKVTPNHEEDFQNIACPNCGSYLVPNS